MAKNKITLFSNGMGHFSKTYSVKKDGEKISIPFKREHIGDVAASLYGIGPVKVVVPPSFSHSTAEESKLVINKGGAMLGLLRDLVGAEIGIFLKTPQNSPSKEDIIATLMGVSVEDYYRHDGQLVKNTNVVLMDQNGSIYEIPFLNCKRIYFTDPVVQREIEKALKRNLQTIKPDSTFVELELKPTVYQDVEATIQYTIPVSVWKMRYSIFCVDDAFYLEGSAIVDNNTDEDWVDISLSVVTGDPVSFQTDIADVTAPDRKFIAIAGKQSFHQHSNDRQKLLSVCSGIPPGGNHAHSEMFRGKMSISHYADFGEESCNANSHEENMMETSGVEAKEVGDFCVFTSKDLISIEANKSAVVPMFSVQLKSAGTVLIYKHSNNESRPYRAVKFNNETEYSLGRGKTIIYNDSVFSGECILDNTKPGENRILPHCLENSVRVYKESGPISEEITSIRIQDEIAYQKVKVSCVTSYKVINKKGENYKMTLEHEESWHGKKTFKAYSEDVEITEEELHNSKGIRSYFDLEANKTYTINVMETTIREEEIEIDGHWIAKIYQTNSELVHNEGIIKCKEIYDDIEKAEEEYNELLQEVQMLNDTAERNRQNLIAAGNNASCGVNANIWFSNLNDAESQIIEITKSKIPAVKDKIKMLKKTLDQTINNINHQWHKK